MFENTLDGIDRFMRNDEGLASELDLAEQISWLLFQKHLNDRESERRDTAELEDRDYLPLLNRRFRWDVWAAPKKGGKLDQAPGQERGDVAVRHASLAAACAVAQLISAAS